MHRPFTTALVFAVLLALVATTWAGVTTIAKGDLTGDQKQDLADYQPLVKDAHADFASSLAEIRHAATTGAQKTAYLARLLGALQRAEIGDLPGEITSLGINPATTGPITSLVVNGSLTIHRNELTEGQRIRMAGWTKTARLAERYQGLQAQHLANSSRLEASAFEDFETLRAALAESEVVGTPAQITSLSYETNANGGIILLHLEDGE